MAPSACTWLSQLQQAVDHSRVSTRYLEYLRPACRPRYQSDRMRADTERLGYCSQRGGRGLAVHRTSVDPHDQRAAVLAAHAGAG